MAGRIAGITVEIGGNTTKLQSALKGVDTSLRNMKSGLRDVDRMLKFNPTSTTLLTQKQQLLKKSIEDTRSRLSQLKEAQAQMDAKGVDKNSEDYQRLQREIQATERNLKQLEKEYEKFASVTGAKMQAVGAKMKEVGAKISEAGQKITTHLTAPIVAFAGLAVKAFQDVDKGMDAVVKKTGATGDALESMKDSVKTLATTIPTDFQTAGDAVGQVATRFGLTGDELETLSGQFIKFAQLNNTDVTTSVNAVQSAMAAFGVETENTGAFLDTLNKVGQDTGADVNRLAQDMTTNAASLKELGFSASDSAHFLGQLSVNGIDTSATMAGLRKAFVVATKEGKPLDKKLAELQDTMKNSKSDTKAYKEALEIFGNRAGPALANAIKEGRLSLDELGTSLEDNVGNIDTTFENTLDPVDKFKMAVNQARVAGAELGNAILTRLTPFIEKLQAGLQTLGDKFKSLSPDQQDMIVKIGLIAAAIGPVVMIIGKLVSGIGSVVSAAGTAISTIKAVVTGTATVTTTIGLGVAAIAALVGGFYLLNKSGEKAAQAQYDFTDAEKESLNAIHETVQAYNDAAKAADEESASVAAQYDHIRELKSEYNSLVDSKGKIAKKDKEHADAILGELAQALGMEKSDIQQLIDKNGKLSGSIDQVIKKKEAQAYLDANYDSYVKAIELETKNNEDLARSLSALSDKETEAAQAKDNLKQRQQEYDNALASGERNLGSYKTRLENAQRSYDAANQKVKEAKSEVKGYADAAQDASTRVQNYSKLQEAVQSGNIKKINAALRSYQNNLKDSTTASQDELEKQAKDYDKLYKAMKKAYDDGDKGITKKQVNTIKKLRDQANKEAGIAVDAAKKGAKGVKDANESAQKSSNSSWSSVFSAISGNMSKAKSNVDSSSRSIKGKFPINIGKVITGHMDIPDIVQKGVKKIAGAAIPILVGASHYFGFAKGYENPKLFTNPTIYGGALFGDKGASRGGELVYGHDSLMSDIRAAVGGANGLTVNMTINGVDNPRVLADQLFNEIEIRTRSM